MIEYTDNSKMPWGSHKGTRMGDVPRPYLKYICKKFKWGVMRPMGEESAAVCDYIFKNGIHKS